MDTIKEYFYAFLRIIDPYKQSFVFFKYKPLDIFVIAVMTVLVFAGRKTTPTYEYGAYDGIVPTLLYNSFTYLPNFLIHEFGHRIMGAFAYRILPVSPACMGDQSMCLAGWLTTAAGNGNETLIPFLTYFFALRFKGGRMVAPVILYWLSSTIYDAAIYVSDARAKLMHLTGSDFVSDWKPGEVNGDWYYILKPFGLLNHDLLIGKIFFFLAAFTFVMAIYSAYYFFTHMEQFAKADNLDVWDNRPQPKGPEKLQDQLKEPALYFDDKVTIFEMEDIKNENELKKISQNNKK